VELASNGRGLSFRFRLNEDTLWGDALPSHLKGTAPILTCLRASTGEYKARPIGAWIWVPAKKEQRG
jgi:hypothetical protein